MTSVVASALFAVAVWVHNAGAERMFCAVSTACFESSCVQLEGLFRGDVYCEQRVMPFGWTTSISVYVTVTVSFNANIVGFNRMSSVK